jgi:hypothetical protein
MLLSQHLNEVASKKPWIVGHTYKHDKVSSASEVNQVNDT